MGNRGFKPKLKRNDPLQYSRRRKQPYSVLAHWVVYNVPCFQVILASVPLLPYYLISPPFSKPECP
ncbi:hypothetical protein C4J98_3805 [Pseudomonas orientalis]|nr:hypothetical protein C4J98_3805 [Pseudomonas orientalis]